MSERSFEDEWFHEDLSIEPKYTKIHWKVKRELFFGRSEYQTVAFYESYDHGILFVLDGVVMTSERDECIYHEAITHTALYMHDSPKNTLIIGGGDYGSAREALKHPEVESVKLCEIDGLVLQKCKEFFPYAKSVLEDPRMNVVTQDGFFLLQESRTQYDVILVDSTEPIGAGEKLFHKDFVRLCFEALHDRGIMVMQCGSPFYSTPTIATLLSEYKQIFPFLYFFTAQCHSYPSGYWGFIVASKHYHPIHDFQNTRYKDLNFQYYNKDLHKASFVLPSYLLKAFQGLLSE